MLEYLKFLFYMMIFMTIAAIAFTWYLKSLHKERLKIGKTELIKGGFQISKEFCNGDSEFAFFVDDLNRKWAFIDAKNEKSYVYDYSDILRYELLENDEISVESNFGSALLGGMAFGTIGAIAGAASGQRINHNCRSLKIHLIVNNLSAPEIYIELINNGDDFKVEKLNRLFKEAYQMLSILEVITSRASKKKKVKESPKVATAFSPPLLPPLPAAPTASDDPVAEIERYHGLMEKGMISRSEYEQKKRQLLGL